MRNLNQLERWSFLLCEFQNLIIESFIKIRRYISSFEKFIVKKKFGQPEKIGDRIHKN